MRCIILAACFVGAAHAHSNLIYPKPRNVSSCPLIINQLRIVRDSGR